MKAYIDADVDETGCVYRYQDLRFCVDDIANTTEIARFKRTRYHAHFVDEAKYDFAMTLKQVRAYAHNKAFL